MKIEYAGPKPIISHHGISFKEGKNDKYSYLISSLQILNAISHDYEGHKIYSYDIRNVELSSSEMIDIILKFHPDIEEVMKRELISYEKYLKNERDEISSFSHLEDENKKIYLSNIDIMRDYRIQRVKNKFFYIHVIETIKEQILEHKIKELTTVFNEKYWHIFQTIQGKLSSSKNSIETKLKVLEEEVLRIRLSILNNI